MEEERSIRSANMAAIKSKGNKTTELALIKILKEEKITGWRRQQKILGSKPDFIFPTIKLAIFVDGCFWHGCPMCYQIPKTNQEFWKNKVWSNKARDRKIDRKYKEGGWRTLHIWEHQIKSEKKLVIRKIRKICTNRQPSRKFA